MTRCLLLHSLPCHLRWHHLSAHYVRVTVHHTPLLCAWLLLCIAAVVYHCVLGWKCVSGLRLEACVPCCTCYVAFIARLRLGSLCGLLHMPCSIHSRFALGSGGFVFCCTCHVALVSWVVAPGDPGCALPTIHGIARCCTSAAHVPVPLTPARQGSTPCTASHCTIVCPRCSSARAL